MAQQTLTLDAASSAAAIGDWLCRVNGTTVTRATDPAVAIYGAAIAWATSAANPATPIRMCTEGVAPPSHTGLAPVAGKARLNTTTARAERVASLSPSDYALGDIDANGYLEFSVEPFAVGTKAELKGIPTPRHRAQVYCVEVSQFYGFDATSDDTPSDPSILAADDATRGNWIISAGVPGIEFLGGSVVSPIGTNRAAAINAALANGATAILLPATYTLETALVLASGSRLKCLTGVARLTPSFVGVGADTATNALVKIQGSVSTATINTTLSASAPRGATTVTVASATGITAGQWLRIQGHNSVDAGGMSDGASVVLTEIAKVTNVAGVTLTLATPLLQYHGNGVSVVACTPVEDVQLEGLELYSPGGTFANGFVCEYARRVEIRRVSGQGFSRALVEMRGGSRRWTVDRVHSNGECNAIVMADSANDGAISGVTSAEDGIREHASGVPRAGITLWERSSDIRVSDCTLQRLPSGLRTWGGVNISFDQILIRDTDTTSIVARDPIIQGAEVGSGVDSGANRIGDESFGYTVNYNNVHVEDAKSPDDATACGWYFHDIFNIQITNCSVNHRGTTTSYTKYGGLYLKDCSGDVESFKVRGCANAFRTRGFPTVDFQHLEVDGSLSDGTGAAYVSLEHGGGAGSSPNIRKLTFGNTTLFVRFGADFQSVPDWRLRIGQINTSIGEMSEAILAYNNTGVSFSVGDVVEMDPASPAGKLYVKTPSGPNPRCGVVVVGGPYDVATGFMLVAPLPTPARCAVTCSSAAVSVGDYLEANASRQGVSQSAPSANAFGRALTNKAAGSPGPVLVGPVQPVESASVTPGTSRAAAINAITSAGGTCTLQPGTYTLESAVTMASGAKLQCLTGTATLQPTFSGSADDPSNATVKAQSTVAGTDETTLSARVEADELTISTVAAPTVGAWYLLRSTNAQGGFTGHTTGSAIVRAEPVKVASVSGSGPYTVTLAQKVAAPHGSGSGLRRITTMVSNVELKGIDFDLVGTTVANGLYCEAVSGIKVDVSGGGASRAPFNARNCRGISGKVFHRGGSNSPVLVESSHDYSLELDYDQESTLGYAHASGIPRGASFTSQSTHGRVTGRIGVCVGVELRGFSNSKWFADVSNCDFTARDSRDSTLITGNGGNRVAGAFGNNTNPASTESEIPYGFQVRCKLTDLRVPDPSGNAMQAAAMFVDCQSVELDLEIVNTGKNPGTSGAIANGVILYDSSAYDRAHFSRLVTRGMSVGMILFGGGNRVEVDVWDHTPQADLTTGTALIDFGHTTTNASSVRIKNLVLSDAPAHMFLDHQGSSGINHDSLRDLVIDRIDVQNGAQYDDVRLCLDVGGLADFGGQAGDVVEIVPPRACTLANASDSFTLAGHDFPDGTPVYLGGTALPGGYTAGTILYVRDSDRASTNTTFKLSASIGGAVFNFSSDGTAVTISPSYRTVRAPTAGASFDKGTRVNGAGFGAGLALPLRHYAVAFGKRRIVRMGAVQVLNGDRIKATAAALTGTVDNASTDPIGIAQGKPSAAAGTVQLV